MSAPVLVCERVTRSYQQGEAQYAILDRLDLTVNAGQTVAIMGASGAGKSTLLHLLGGLDVPDSGRISVAGTELNSISDADRGRLRNRFLGFIYQFHHLLAEFSALENVAMPLLIRSLSPMDAQTRATTMLEQVGLGHRLDHRPSQLSGGERQRAAIARALVTRPACVLADEPTGNLDRRNSARALDLMLELNRELETSLVIVTHDASIAERMDRVLVLEDGTLHGDERRQ